MDIRLKKFTPYVNKGCLVSIKDLETDDLEYGDDEKEDAIDFNGFGSDFDGDYHDHDDLDELSEDDDEGEDFFDDSEYNLYVFDYEKLSDDDREDLLEAIEFVSFPEIRDAIEEMTPFGIFYDPETIEELFDGEITLKNVISEEVNPSGQVGVLLIENATGKILCIDEGELIDFSDSATSLTVGAAV